MVGSANEIAAKCRSGPVVAETASLLAGWPTAWMTPQHSQRGTITIPLEGKGNRESGKKAKRWVGYYEKR